MLPSQSKHKKLNGFDLFYHTNPNPKSAVQLLLAPKSNTGSLQFPLGISAAVCVRVGNALGAGNTNRAIVTCKVALILSGTV